MKYSEKHKGLKFLAPPNLRLHRNFFGVMVDFDSPKYGHHWSSYYNKWMPASEIDKGWHSTHFEPCRTLRAFKRHLRRHPEMVGHLRLCNRSHYTINDLDFETDVLSVAR